MIEIMQSHWISIAITVFTLLVTPFYWFLVLESSNNSMDKCCHSCNYGDYQSI